MKSVLKIKHSFQINIQKFQTYFPLPAQTTFINPKMQSQLSCPLCNFEYCEQKTPRILSMCGHTFCETCIETLIIPQGEDKFKIICPQDDATSELTNDSLNQFPINKVLLKIIESNKSKTSFKDSSFDVSKIVKQQQLQEDQQTKQLISAIQQSQNQKSQLTQKSGNLNPQNSTQGNNSTAHTVSKKGEDPKKEEQSQSQAEDENICLLHQKPLEIVCVVDLEKICAKCAIFGKHKGHDFKSLQQIEQENTAFSNQLLAVYEQKTVILNRVQNKETKSDLLAILNGNKQNLTKQLKQRFKKLIDAVKSQQKKALTKLQKYSLKIEKDIDELYNIEPSLVEKYEEWERHSFKKLKIIQSGTFDEKLQLILVDQANDDKNIILQGKKIVDQIKAQQNTIIAKAQVFLTNINMKTNDKILEFVETYVEVFDKPPESPKVEPIKIEPTIKSFKDSNNLMLDSGKKNSEDDLLQNQQLHEDQIIQRKVEIQPSQSKTTKKQQNFAADEVKFVPILSNKLFEDKPAPKQQQHRQQSRRSTMPPQNFTVQELKRRTQIIHENITQNYKQEDSFVADKIVRPTKKKLKTIKVPEKYEKALQALYADNFQTLDLTNAELGDNVILQICQFVPGTKLKTIKFIRNKLTDDCVVKMLPFMSNIITLNLSQNLLTERVLDILIDNRQLLPKVKSIILSLNKIIERKHKSKIDELRKFDITVSV